MKPTFAVPTLWMTFFFKKVKEKKYTWERNILITHLSTVVLRADGMTDFTGLFLSNVQKMDFNF